MILGMHGMVYSSDPEATREFFRRNVRLPGNDVGEGWWIFDFREGDLGVHPTDDPEFAGTHDISFYCDDIQATVADLQAQGVEFTSGVEDRGWGLATTFTAPGGISIMLYQPSYQKQSRARAKPAAKRNAVRGKAKRTRAAAKRVTSRKRR